MIEKAVNDPEHLSHDEIAALQKSLGMNLNHYGRHFGPKTHALVDKEAARLGIKKKEEPKPDDKDKEKDKEPPKPDAGKGGEPAQPTSGKDTAPIIPAPQPAGDAG